MKVTDRQLVYCTTVSTVVAHFCSGACALFSPPCEIPSRQSIRHQKFPPRCIVSFSNMYAYIKLPTSFSGRKKKRIAIQSATKLLYRNLCIS